MDVVKGFDKVETRSEKDVKPSDKHVKGIEKGATPSGKVQNGFEEVKNRFVNFRRCNRKTGSAFFICQKRILRDEMVGKKIIFSGNPVEDEAKTVITKPPNFPKMKKASG